jgi:hypothetical protein
LISYEFTIHKSMVDLISYEFTIHKNMVH